MPTIFSPINIATADTNEVDPNAAKKQEKVKKLQKTTAADFMVVCSDDESDDNTQLDNEKKLKVPVAKKIGDTVQKLWQGDIEKLKSDGSIKFKIKNLCFLQSSTRFSQDDIYNYKFPKVLIIKGKVEVDVINNEIKRQNAERSRIVFFVKNLDNNGLKDLKSNVTPQKPGVYMKVNEGSLFLVLTEYMNGSKIKGLSFKDKNENAVLGVFIPSRKKKEKRSSSRSNSRSASFQAKTRSNSRSHSRSISHKQGTLATTTPHQNGRTNLGRQVFTNPNNDASAVANAILRYKTASIPQAHNNMPRGRGMNFTQNPQYQMNTMGSSSRQ